MCPVHEFMYLPPWECIARKGFLFSLAALKPSDMGVGAMSSSHGSDINMPTA